MMGFVVRANTQANRDYYALRSCDTCHAWLHIAELAEQFDSAHGDGTYLIINNNSDHLVGVSNMGTRIGLTEG